MTPGEPPERLSAKAAARATTRQSLLRAAARMLFEAPSADPIGALRPVDVSRRAVPPRSTGAFYNIWPTQADFRRDVLHHVLSTDRFTVGAPTVDLLAALTDEDDVCLAEIVRLAGNLTFDGLKDESALRLKQALWSRHQTDPDVRELLADLYTAISDQLRPHYVRLLDRAGRRMRPPYTYDDLAVALTALSEGLVMRWAVQPEAVPDGVTGPAGVPGPSVHERWTCFSSVAWTLLQGMTEPV